MQKKTLARDGGVPFVIQRPCQTPWAFEQFDDADLPAMKERSQSTARPQTGPHVKFVVAAYLYR